MYGLVDGNNFFVSCERVIDPRLEGRPVAVLSNNDGCCVSRSNEFKALGIPMGTPYFKLKDREASGELVFRSSNYELYGDLSRRIISILNDEAVQVEQYSIDEAFVIPPTSVASDYAAWGSRLRAKILQWVGIPCGVGFAPTKTLAKIANHIGKKCPEGVFVMPEDPTPVLEKLPVGEVWGVGRRLPVKLKAERIFTALDLRDADHDLLQRIGGVTLERTALELRGMSCVQDRAYDADPDSVSCSRSFGTQVTTVEDLTEAIASFTAQAAVKLRKHGMLAAGCNVYAQVAKSGLFDSRAAYEGSFVGRTVLFPHVTDATNEMLQAIRPMSEALFIPETRYRKAGMVFFGLEKANAFRQADLFAPPPVQASKLYKVVDALNARLGKHTVFSAAEGLSKTPPSWHMSREKLSPRATTNWNELLTVS